MTGRSEFRNSWAVVVGINEYAHGIPPLQTAVGDAQSLARILKQEHGYSVHLLTQDVTLQRLRGLLTETLPEQVGVDDRVLFYFAGHGVALDGDEGPAGFAVPQDARLEDSRTLLPMPELHDALTALPCRHLLAILDCCFAGAFRWSSTRDLRPLPEVIHQERYDRFIIDPAWQVITSAAYDQKALDLLSGDLYGERGQKGRHSPFALALFEALAGAGDVVPAGGGDGVITATELYLYLRDNVEVKTSEQGRRQTPGLWPLNKHDKGEYIFLVPGHELNLPAAPALTAENNPYRGLQPYEEEHSALFFGREALIEDLAQQVTARPLTVVLGASGTGKSSLVKAGLVPYLGGSHAVDSAMAEQGDSPWLVLPPLRPSSMPLRSLQALLAAHLPAFAGEAMLERLGSDPGALADLVASWGQHNAGRRLMLVIDQLEELVTLCRDDPRREWFLRLLAGAIGSQAQTVRVVLTVRSDFEPQFSTSALAPHWGAARFIVPPMSQDELREVVEEPASARVLYFEPHDLVDRLINEVIQTPGALPLLSFTLSELYVKYLRSGRDNRALCMQDYEMLGGVVGSLRNRATEEYQQLGLASRETMQRIMLRMVAVEGGELARRRVPRSELVYPDDAENERVGEVIRHLVDARLVVEGREEDGEAYVEPAHDALVRAWDKLLLWQREAEEYLPLQRRVAQAARDWEGTADEKSRTGLLWNDNPRLPQLQQVLMPQTAGWSGSRSLLQRVKQALWPAMGISEEPTWLNRLETCFVLESIRQRAVNLRRLVAGVGTAFVALSILTAIAFYQRNQAERQARRALSGQFAAQAQTVLDAYPQRSLLLAVEALDTTMGAGEPRVPAAEQVMRDALANCSGRGLGTHQAAVWAVAISPDGRWLATGSEDNTARLWDLMAEDPAASSTVLRGHASWVCAVAVSADGRWLVTGSWDNTVRLWDLMAEDPAASSTVLRGHEDRVNTVAISPDSRWAVSGSDDQTARLWDLMAEDPTGSSIVLRGHDDWIATVAISPDNRWVVTAGGDNTARLWDLAAKDPAGSSIVLRGHEDRINALAISPDGRWLVTGSEDNTARLWDLAAEDPAASPVVLRGHVSGIEAVAIHPAGHLLVTGSRDSTARLWQLNVRDPAASSIVLASHKDAVGAVAVSSDGRWLATGSWDNTVRLWDLRAADVAATSVVLEGHENWVYALAIDPGGHWLATGSWDNTVRLWDLTAVDVAATSAVLGGHEDWVEAVAISSDSHWLVTGSDDNTARLWDLTAEDLAASSVVLRGHESYISAVAISPDSHWLVTGSKDNTARLWNLQAADPAASSIVLRGHEGWVDALAYSSDGRWLVTGGEDSTARLWDLTALDPAGSSTVLRGHESWVCAVAISADGRWLVTGSWDTTARLWDLRADDPAISPTVLSGHESMVQAVAISPDSRWAVTGSDDQTVRLWDLRAEDPAAAPIVLRGHEGAVWALAVSPDSHWLVTGSSDQTARLWDLRAHDPAASSIALRGHEGVVEEVAISSDSRWAVTGSDDQTVRLWDLRAEDPAAAPIVLRGHKDAVGAVAMSPDGRWLATGSYDGTARLWPLRLHELIDLACRTAGRNFTRAEWTQYFPDQPYRKTCSQWPLEE